MRSSTIKPIKLLVALIIFLAIISCTPGIQSYSTKAKDADLKKYKSYAWIMPTEADTVNQKDDKIYAALILALANEELAKKGFILNTQDPDALFIFDTRVENRVSQSRTPQVSVGIGFGGPGYYAGVSGPVAGGQVVEKYYEEGMLMIEMFDTKTQQSLWKGWAQKQLTIESDTEDDIRMAVKHIFMRLPVKHK